MKKQILALSQKILSPSLKKSIFHLAFNLARDEFDEFAYRYAFAPDMGRALKDARNRGLAANVIVDVGAYQGGWTTLAKSIWPHAKIFMVEANDEKRDILSEVSRRFDAELHFALLGAQEKENVDFVVMEAGSSVLEENSNFERRTEKKCMQTLDSVLGHVDHIDLLKIDTQGYEIEVLTGATRLLNTASAVLLEVSLIEINKGAPLIHDILPFMKQRGFVSYEIVNTHRRHFDGAMNQIDILFVREESPLISNKSFS